MTRSQFSLGRLLAVIAVIALLTGGLLPYGSATVVVGMVNAVPIGICLLFGPNCRAVLPAAYGALILVPCSVVALAMHLPKQVVALTILAYALPLFATYFLDHWVLGGIGYHSPAIFLVLALMVAATLWPLGLLSVARSWWRRRACKHIIMGYLGLFLTAASLAAWQMTKSWGLFFG